MTTVAYHNGVLAADGRLTADGHIVSSNFVKIIATKRFLAGISGQADYIAKFFDWVKKGCDEKNIPKSANNTIGAIDAFTVDADGVITTYGEDMLPLRLGKLPFYAIGSGAPYAMGAMAMGATAQEAVRIAAKYDSATGGRIITRTFKM